MLWTFFSGVQAAIAVLLAFNGLYADAVFFSFTSASFFFLGGTGL